ncbi:hypothetical protein FF1_043198 [Malus domestica]
MGGGVTGFCNCKSRMSSKLLGRRGGRQGRHDVGVVEGRVRDGERDLSDRVRQSKSNRISQIGRGLVDEET